MGQVSTEMKNLARTTTQMNYDMASAASHGLEGPGRALNSGFWGPQKIEDIKRFREVRKRISNTNHYYSWKGLVYLFDKQNKDWKLQKPTVMRGGYPIGSHEYRAFFWDASRRLPETRSSNPTQFDTVSEHPKVFLSLQNGPKKHRKQMEFLRHILKCRIFLLRFTDFSLLNLPANMPWKLVEDLKNVLLK